ncbi:hypothetical protein F4824DRAFT_357864 [Ustulina deusta]|nr:hypothetical protein F4824DRAFT_357864 [Ustulina deusta]
MAGNPGLELDQSIQGIPSGGWCKEPSYYLSTLYIHTRYTSTDAIKVLVIRLFVFNIVPACAFMPALLTLRVVSLGVSRLYRWMALVSFVLTGALIENVRCD